MTILNLSLAGTNNSLLNMANSAEIPVISESKATCPCTHSQNSPCRGGIYIDYYYKPPYSGYPENSSYLPPHETVPVIIDRLTEMRDVVKDFVASAANESSNVQKALFVKNNFSKVHFILAAISRAANSTNAQSDN